MPQPHSRRRRTLAFAMIMVAGISSACDSTHAASGDPGGAILDHLLAVRRAVPPGATDLRQTGQEPTWVSSCTNETHRNGWSMVQFYVSFTWHGSVGKLENYAKNRMPTLHWRFVSTSQDSGLSPFSNSPAKNTAMQWTDGSGTAYLTISQPVTYRRGDPIPAEFNGGAPPVRPVGVCSGG